MALLFSLDAFEALIDENHVGELEIFGQAGDVSRRIDRAGQVIDRVVAETADQVADGIDLLEAIEGFGVLLRILLEVWQQGDFDGRWGALLRVVEGDEMFQSRVVDWGQAETCGQALLPGKQSE